MEIFHFTEDVFLEEMKVWKFANERSIISEDVEIYFSKYSIIIGIYSLVKLCSENNRLFFLFIVINISHVYVTTCFRTLTSTSTQLQLKAA